MLSHSFLCVRKLSSFRSPLLRSLQQNHPFPRKTLIPSLSLLSNPLFPPSTFSHFSTSVSDFTITSKCSPIPVVVEEKDESNIGYRNTDAYAAIELALDSVVKIFTVSSSPNYFLPWQNKSQRETVGSGFVITGRRILINAHVVADHTFVLVRKHGSPTKYRAEIQAIGHECDLALLTVESEEFWEGMRFLELGDIPFLQEAVAVVGYPQDIRKHVEIDAYDTWILVHAQLVHVEPI